MQLLKIISFLVLSLLINPKYCEKVDKLQEDVGQVGGLQEAFTWSRISYIISDDDYHKAAQPKSLYQILNNKPKIIISENNETLEFVYQNNIPMGANRWRNKLFIFVPRRRDGVLSTLNYVPMHSMGQHNVPLIPYPDFETNKHVEPAEEFTNRFVSVYRVAVDVCDRLWFADTGRIQTTGTDDLITSGGLIAVWFFVGNNRRVQPQSLYVMDLTTDKIIRKYQFKETDIADLNGLFAVTVDTTIRTCNDAYAYLPDSLGRGIVVYSFKSNDSWRFEHESFAPEPNQNGFPLGGVSVLFTDGIFSISLSQTKRDDYKDAYYHPMMGISLYKVSTRILKNKSLAGSGKADDFKLVGKRQEKSQTTNSGLHQSSGLMFFAMAAQSAVECWNSNHPFRATDFDLVYKDEVKMIYPSDLKIYKNDLIVMSNRFPIFFYIGLNYEETNFRVFMNSVYEAARGTKCLPF